MVDWKREGCVCELILLTDETAEIPCSVFHRDDDDALDAGTVHSYLRLAEEDGRADEAREIS